MGCRKAMRTIWLLAQMALAQLQLRVTSTSRSNGNHAEFEVNGQVLDISVGRGVNVVVVALDGSVASSASFDTHGAGSEALEAFVARLAPGKLVLMGVKDDAWANMSLAAKDAIAACGGELIRNLTYRGSYALIGIKGGEALDEQTFADGQVAIAAATFDTIKSYNITVTSTSRSNGNRAIFMLDGTQLAVLDRRGLNVVTLTSAGLFDAFQNFDTFASGSDDLVSFLQGLENGTVVLIGARDDASNNISSAAQAAVRSCGATLIESLSYRGSYALIGVKGGAALAEQAFLDGGPVAVASAIYAIYLSQTASTSTTSTVPTTTTVPFCTMLTCPPGFVQIGGNGTTLRGADVSTCCSEAEEGMAEVGVRSAGFSDGNEATFVANGREVFRAPQRGLTLVTLRPDATRLDAETFDTMATDSEALAAFVGSLANGTLVLVGASDEASLNLTASAKAALRTLGARLIEGLGFRAGYALVGVKGASALAEDLSPMGAGYAVAFASIQVQIPLDARPLCDPMDPDLPVAGHASLGNLRLDAGCRYQLFEGADAQRCLAGSWLVISGSSNALLGFRSLLNFLAPQEYEIERSNERVGSSMVADVVVENGRVVHWASLSSQVPACWQQNLHLARENWKACKLATQELLLRAPAYSSTAVRVTVLVSLFWYRTELALEVLREDLGWGVEAQVALIVQVGSWYSVCAVSTECPRQELLGLDTVQVFEREMSQAFRALEPFCESRRCFVQTLSWTNLHRDQANFQRMNAHIQEASAARAGLRLMDVYGLGRSMPEEVINGHGSQQLNLWVWTVTLNALCPFYQPLPDSRIAGASHFARWEGLSCSAAQARWENCPGYYPACLHTRCEMWECMHAVPCTLRAAVPPSFDASGATFAAFGAGAVCGERLNVSRLASPAEELWVCHRLWCRPRAAAPLAIAALLSALVLGACVRAKRQATEETKAQKEERSGAKAEDLPMDTHVPTEMPEVPLEMPEKRKKKTVVWRESGPWPSPEQVISLQIEQPRHEESRAELDFGPPVEVEFLERSTAPCESPKDQHQALRAAFPAAARPTPQCPELTDLFFNVASKTTSLENQSRQRSTASLAKCPAYMAPPERFALGLARVLAATHVLLGNLVASNDRDVTAAFGEQFAYFCGCGFTWAPWFFMVSGFVLFSSELKDPKEENILQYVLRRSTGIYPLYAILLVPSFLIATTFNSASDWQTLVAQCFLVQAWIPSLTERCLQMHCWFLSCMLAFWFLFVPLACVFRNISLLATSLLMGLCFCLPWLTVLIPLALMEPLDWHQSPELGEVSVMLKYHPACYLHVFVLGMLLARLRQHLDARGADGGMGLRSWAALQLAAPAGYLGLMAVFCIQELQALSYELLAPSCVLPFQAMVVLGLAGVPSLPLPFFAFACSRLDFLEPYAYALYLCQGLCFQVWPFGPERFGLGWFLVFNFSVSYLVATLVQMPAQRWWASRGCAVKCLVPCLLAAAMLGFSSLPDAIRETPLSEIPVLVVLDRMVDMRLELPLDDALRDGASIINPSILVNGNETVVVARLYWRETEKKVGIFNGPNGSQDAILISQMWHSEVLMGNCTFDASAWEAWPSSDIPPLRGLELKRWTGLRAAGGGGWARLCVSDVWEASNATVVRTVTGPEDPKVVLQKNRVVLAFNSAPPALDGNFSTCRRNAGGLLEAVAQMYVAYEVEAEAASVAHRLSYGDGDLEERNWIPFTHQDSLYFVYSLVPKHVVLAVGSNGTSELSYSTTFRPLQQLTLEFPQLKIAGSAQAVLVRANSSENVSVGSIRPSGFDHFLGMLQIYNPETRRSLHHFYRFQADPPFMVLEVSGPVPLWEAEPAPQAPPFATPSGLAVEGGTVAVTYGAGERQARALVMSLERLDELFACSAYV